MAQADYDVWGLDFRWTNVPVEAGSDLGFMDDWGIAQDAGDLATALFSARIMRILTRSGGGRLHLLGYSRGGRNGYAYLNSESQWPRVLRNVKTFIPFDATFKAGTEELRQGSCDSVTVIEQAIAAGIFADDFSFLALAGELATVDPDGGSPIFPGLTNRQASLIIGSGAFRQRVPSGGWRVRRQRVAHRVAVHAGGLLERLPGPWFAVPTPAGQSGCRADRLR